MSSIIPESVPPEYPLLYFLLDYKQREEDKEFVDLLMAVQDASLHKPDQIAQLRWREDLMVSHDEMNSRHFFEFPSQDLDYETWQSNSLVTLWCGDSLLYGRRNKVEKEEGIVESEGVCTIAVLFKNELLEGVNLHEVTGAITVKSVAKGQHRPAFIRFANDYFSDNNNAWRVTSELLKRSKPRFLSNYESTFTDPEKLNEIISHLDNSYFTVQGPPGAGKTYWGARMIHYLLQQGKRVGITSQGWNGIKNLYDTVIELLEDDSYKTIYGGQRGVSYNKFPPEGERTGEYYRSGDQLVAWSTHFWAALGNAEFENEQEKQNHKFDYLFIDEAGQVSLYDALVASLGARNVVLLGDSQQLPQVTKGSHEFGAGASILEHITGEVSTIQQEMGLLLKTTRRMRPEICSFISEEFYDGKLTSTGPANERHLEFANGLRWLNARHSDERTNYSPEEVRIVVEIISKMNGGKKWVDWVAFDDETGEPIGEPIEEILDFHDFMVIAPYNRQVKAIQNELVASFNSKGLTEEIAEELVGTVDKFQGKEAPVVIYSMTTSNENCIPAGREDFIFKPNRLNVAVSRAQCLAIVLANEELVDTRTNQIETMEHLNHLCRYFSDEGVASRLKIED